MIKRSKKTQKTGRSTIFGRGWSTFNSATAKQLQEPNNVTYHAEFVSESSSHQAVTAYENRQKLPLPTGEGWGEGSTFNSAIIKQLQEPNNKTDLRRVKQKRVAFTLAEVLITLGIIGVVAALTLPALLTNVQAKIKAEQIRSAKYKFSLATEKMARLNLIGSYDSTDAFVDELQKHLKISKRCDVSNLRGCWPYETVDLGNGKTWKIGETRTGAELGMTTDANNDYSSNNVGIVTADGTPMILSYNKKCPALDSTSLISWAKNADGKPAENNSADCVASVFEINGTGKPNKLSSDVILFNAKKLGSACAFEVGSICFSAPYQPKIAMTYAECEAEKESLGIKKCDQYRSDYWAAGVKHCGGASKVATYRDLERLANSLYKDGKLDSNAAVALGIPDSGITFYAQEDGAYVWGYYFSPSRHLARSGLNRGWGDRPVICKGK